MNIANLEAGSVVVPTLPNGGSISFTVTATVTATSGTVANIFTATPPGGTTDPTPATVTDTDTVNPIADLTVTKSDGVASVNAGAATTYTLTLTNNGPSAANGATVSDAVAAGLTKTAIGACVAAGGAVCPTVGAGAGQMNLANLEAGSVVVPTLPNGGSISFTVTATVTASSGTVSNIFTATPPGGTTDPTPASVTDTDTVITPNLTLIKSASSPAFTVGAPSSFTLTASNALGTAPTVGNIVVTDLLPMGLTYVAAGSGGAGWGCISAGQTVTCTTAAVIAAGATATPITINVTVGSNAVPSVTNTATVSGGGELAVNTGNNSAVLMVPVNNPAMNTFLTDGAQTALPGTSVLYTHVFNAGVAGNVSFATTNVSSPIIAGWGVQVYRDNNCNGLLEPSENMAVLVGSIAVIPGDQVCIIVKSNVPVAVPYNAQDVITVSATFVPVAGPNIVYTRQDVTTVGATGGAGLVLMKSVRNVTQGGAAGTANTARPGDVLEYVITYTNTAGSAVMSIIISDNTPGFSTFNSASCGAPLPAAISACNVTTQPSVGGAGNVQWTLTGALNAAQSGTVVFRIMIQ